MEQKLPIKEALKGYHLHTASGRTLPFGVGCAFLGERDGKVTEDAIREDSQLMESCYESGFRIYDTSCDYGPSEDVVGRFIQHIDRKSIFLCTKSRFDFHEHDAFETFKRTFYRSFERLHTDYVDLYQIHDTNNYNVCVREVIPFLRERQAEGMIGYIGMGTRDLNALELGVRDGGLDSVLSYLEYSILKSAAQPLIDVCKEKDAAFLNAAVLHYGVVKADDPLNFHDLWWDGRPFIGGALHIRQAAHEMQQLLKKLDVPAIPAALQVSMLNPDIDVTLNGIRRASNLASTLAALDHVIYPEQWAQILALREQLPFHAVQELEG